MSLYGNYNILRRKIGQKLNTYGILLDTKYQTLLKMLDYMEFLKTV